MALSSAFLLLAACATAPSTQTAGTRAPAPAETSSRAAQVLSAAGGADAPTQAEVERLFGAADIVRQDGAGSALTYRLNSCALLLVFAADTRNALRLAEAHASARRSGEPTPTLATCAEEADARRR